MLKLYKYRSITNEKELSKCSNLNNLINNIAIFSSRKQFNDIFDSKIHLNMPSFEEFKKLEQHLKGKDLQEYRTWREKGCFSPIGKAKLALLEKEFTKLIDSYPIYCLSGTCQSNLMWSHYADSHKGFCIEFNREKIYVKEITYQSSIPSIDILPMIMQCFKIGDKNQYYDEIYKKFGQEIHEKLHIKLNDWEYENECRIIQSGNKFKNNETKYVKPYDRNDVNGIIFGCRMEKKVKKYILDNTDFPHYSQAVECKDTIEIVDFNRNKHL